MGEILKERITDSITPGILSEIQHVVDLGMTLTESRPLLDDIAVKHGLRKYRVRGTFRLLIQEAANR